MSIPLDKQLKWVLVIVISFIVVLATMDWMKYISHYENMRKISQSEEGVLAANLSVYKKEIGVITPLNNRLIVDAITGKNAKNKVFIKRNELRLNSHGEVIDPTGQPYIFSYSEGYPVVSSKSLGTSIRDVTGYYGN